MKAFSIYLYTRLYSIVGGCIVYKIKQMRKNEKQTMIRRGRQGHHASSNDNGDDDDKRMVLTFVFFNISDKSESLKKEKEEKKRGESTYIFLCLCMESVPQ